MSEVKPSDTVAPPHTDSTVSSFVPDILSATPMHEFTDLDLGIVQGILQSYAALLPEATSNIHMPFATPLRWHEERYTGDPEDNLPRIVNLWAIPHKGRLITFSRNLRDTGNSSRMRVHTREPSKQTGFQYEMEITVPAQGDRLSVNAGTYNRGIPVGQIERFDEYQPYRELNPAEKVRRAEIASHVLALVQNAERVVPARQRDFMQSTGLERVRTPTLVRELKLLGHELPEEDYTITEDDVFAATMRNWRRTLHMPEADN